LQHEIQQFELITRRPNKMKLNELNKLYKPVDELARTLLSFN